MKKNKSKIICSPLIYLFLFSIYPVLFLYFNNTEFFPIRVVFSPVLVVLIFTFFILGLSSLFTINIHQASLFTSFLMFMILSYVHLHIIFRWLYRWLGGQREVNDLSFLFFIIWLVLTVVFLILITKKNFNFRHTKILNYVSIILMLVLLITTFSLPKGSNYSDIDDNLISKESKSAVLGFATIKPDVYYIILDGYGRSDVLSEKYDYDNFGFTEFLRNSGFKIVEKASSNYIQTALSVASSLNFDYIPNLISNIDKNSNDRDPLNSLIKESMAVSVFEQNGYKIYAVSSGYFGTEIKKFSIDVVMGNSMGEFNQAVIYSTPLPVFLGLAVREFPSSIAQSHRNRILGSFENLKMISSYSGPKFVFAHIMSPHPPFLFGENGEYVSDRGDLSGFDGSHFIGKEGMTKEKYLKFYREQAKFVANQTQDVIKKILSQHGDSSPVVIILQSDHGPGSGTDWENIGNTDLGERQAILLAFYFSEGKYDDLSEDLTPVNALRIIFNRYLGTDYQILEDKNYFSTWSKPYDFIEVTDKVD